MSVGYHARVNTPACSLTLLRSLLAKLELKMQSCKDAKNIPSALRSAEGIFFYSTTTF